MYVFIYVCMLFICINMLSTYLYVCYVCVYLLYVCMYVYYISFVYCMNFCMCSLCMYVCKLFMQVCMLCREREMFYLTTHSTHFIYGYMASDIWLRTILIVRKETRCRHIGYSYRLTARVLLYAPSHRQDNTYHGLCYTSRGALAGTRNSSMGPPVCYVCMYIIYIYIYMYVCVYDILYVYTCSLLFIFS